MTLNLYYSVKDPEHSVSFKNNEWLTPYQVLDKLGVRNLLSYQINPNFLIYPCELIISESSQSINDIILLAKYTDKYGGLKLESIFLSQLISLLCISNSNSSILINRVKILSIEKDTYYWESVRNSNYIPKYSFRVGFDNLAKQFSYIGRMKVSLINENWVINNNLRAKITNLFGSLINIYEYIPAIVLQLHELDNRLDSLWSKIKFSIKNNSTTKDFNLIANNYEVLCLKKQPASLKQLCVNKLVKFEEDTNYLHNKHECLNETERRYLEINKSLKCLPNSIRNMLWPSFLVPGQCLGKNSKMRSSNGLYELSLNEFGNLRFSLNMYGNNKITYEKNVESLLVSNDGIFVVYENNRRPTLLYKHQRTISDDSEFDDNFNRTIFDSLLCSSYVMELSNDGFLRVIIHKSRPNVIQLINVNEYFRPVQKEQIITNITITKENDMTKAKSQSLLINVKFVTELKDLKELPIKIISLVVKLLKSLFQSFSRQVPIHDQHIN
ncbi:unnamed protein product [Brachionus calyciflorus]|uniref:Uncharacterized protein n=1 Tax=Brachionus calyciflorus TaxID=104777 RepID=A0A813UYF0_9BILA|nr:unnamed protein product [Brachionus calyciflorus]